MIYLYDDSFEGFLTCIYEHYYSEKAENIKSKSKYQKELFSEYKEIVTNYEKAMKVTNGIKDKVSYLAYNHIYKVFLSCEDNKELLLLKYIVLAFKVGAKVDNMHTDDIVLPIHKIAKKVSFEAHRFLGILRFIEVDSLLYASIEPDHNIIPLIARHFSDRLKNENFLIHDKKRKIALAYNKKEYIIIDIEEDIPYNISDNEKRLQELWKGYFEHIGIESRKNDRLQRQFVPVRYRKNITEFR